MGSGGRRRSAQGDVDETVENGLRVEGGDGLADVVSVPRVCDGGEHDGGCGVEGMVPETVLTFCDEMLSGAAAFADDDWAAAGEGVIEADGGEAPEGEVCAAEEVTDLVAGEEREEEAAVGDRGVFDDGPDSGGFLVMAEACDDERVVDVGLEEGFDGSEEDVEFFFGADSGDDDAEFGGVVAEMGDGWREVAV